MEQSYLSDSGEDEQNGESQDLNATEDTRKYNLTLSITLFNIKYYN